MEALARLRSRTVVLPHADIDTDQIIPARFLTTTRRDGLGAQLFHDWRFDGAGEARTDFVLNRPESAGCAVLVGGRNFGCGSSREHAPWALLDYGFRAVISSRVADIFRNNALKNGLLPVELDEDTHGWLLANPGAEIAIDVERLHVALPDGREVPFELDGFARYCLLNGTDQLGFLLARAAEIAAFERRRDAVDRPS